MKFDYSDAYRRVSHDPSAAVQSIIILGAIAYVALRLAFGGSPNPACFCAFSETLTDLSNDISTSPYEPTDFTAPTVEPEHLEEKECMPDDAPFGQGILPAVELPIHSTSRKDCFIDDIIAVFLDTIANRRREGHVVPLAVHLMSRPHAGDDHEPVVRRPLLAPDKLSAEGRPCEVQIVLGWEVNTRRLTVALPFDKFTAWMGDIEEVISGRQISIEDLESLVGRLNHAAYLIPLSRHFINPLREKIDRRPFAKKRKVRLNQEEILDLELWKHFLGAAREGISMNLLTIRTPTAIAWSDSCPFGLGGYTLSGRAWRVRVGSEWSFRGEDAANNVLEFLGMAVSILLMIDEKEQHEFPCLLALGDNTSAIGWIFRSSRIGRESKYFKAVRFISRTIAKKSIEAKVLIHSQHIQGKLNDVADILSYEGDDRGEPNEFTCDRPDNACLTKRFHTLCPQIIPENFLISDLPQEIESFVLATLQTLEDSWTRNKNPLGVGRRDTFGTGDLSCSPWGSKKPSWKVGGENPENSSAAASLSNSETTVRTSRSELLQSVRNRWWSQLCAMPSAMWVRRLGTTGGEVPFTSADGRDPPQKV